jgi:hypothetical protein
MQNEFLPYDRALKLKQLGFDEEGFGTYNANGEVLPLMPYTTESKAILFQQAFRWFREKHGMVFNLVGSGPYYPSIAFILIDGNSDIELGEYDNYEEAELACLDKLIEIVETKQQEQ